MLKLTTIEELQRLIDEGIEESLTLDYKSSGALSNSKARAELCKDVSAFANSAGGQIIYGVEEQNRKPTTIDHGSEVTREWIEQVIESNIQPRLEGLIIKPILIRPGRYVYVITVPQAVARAPHQSTDRKYYKRQNFQSVAMEDYEIRDTFRRATTSELYIELSFAMGPMTPIDFAYESEISNPITINVNVKNRSPQPAFYALVQLGIDTDLQILASPNFMPLGITGYNKEQYWLGHRFTSPPGLPIFREIDQDPIHQLSLTVACHSSLLRGEHLFQLTTSISNSRIFHHGQLGYSPARCQPAHASARELYESESL